MALEQPSELLESGTTDVPSSLPAPGGAPALDDEVVSDVDTDAAFAALVSRLSRQSVEKHYDAYADLDWDDPANAIDPTDPRFALGDNDPLGASEWYKAQPVEVQARIGLWRVVTAMKIGMQFENILKRGLLDYALSLPNGSPEFRYAYHETIEEAHHGLMFQEFVNRSGLPIEGMPKPMRDAARFVSLLGRVFPELFFFFVLGGEDPIDHVQRRALREARTGTIHPLLAEVMRHHVTEEARHLSFARHWLKTRVPRLGTVRRGVLSMAVPVILGNMAQVMLAPPGDLAREFAVPREVLSSAFRQNPEAQAEMRRSLRKVRRLAVELGLVNRASLLVWRAFRIWDDDQT